MIVFPYTQSRACSSRLFKCAPSQCKTCSLLQNNDYKSQENRWSFHVRISTTSVPVTCTTSRKRSTLVQRRNWRKRNRERCIKSIYAFHLNFPNHFTRNLFECPVESDIFLLRINKQKQCNNNSN